MHSGNNCDELLNSILYDKSSTDTHDINKQLKNKNCIITYIIILINIFMYMITSYFSNNIMSINSSVLINLGAKVNYLINQGQYYRLITCMFLHGGLLHIVFNMYALYSIGPLSEAWLGKTKYIIVYFLSGILGSIFSYLMSESISIGASGAIFGILGSMLVLAYKNKEKLGNKFLKSILSVVVANLIIGLSIKNIDNFGHLGGLLGGIISTFILFDL